MTFVAVGCALTVTLRGRVINVYDSLLKLHQVGRRRTRDENTASQRTVRVWLFLTSLFGVK
jgi:hypothetical protein